MCVTRLTKIIDESCVFTPVVLNKVFDRRPAVIVFPACRAGYRTGLPLPAAPAPATPSHAHTTCPRLRATARHACAHRHQRRRPREQVRRAQCSSSPLIAEEEQEEGLQVPARAARQPQSVRRRDGSVQVATLRATKAGTLDVEEGPRPLGAAFSLLCLLASLLHSVRRMGNSLCCCYVGRLLLLTVNKEGQVKHARDVLRAAAEYMALPASQYSVLDAQRIERLDESTFRCYVGGMRLFSLVVEPVLTVSVVVGDRGPTVKLLQTEVRSPGLAAAELPGLCTVSCSMQELARRENSVGR